ncbi:MAG: hypothetical protein U5R30_01885 [Deltaproteobacteria bacterium]|nr:hypothetical protein [Deltaproteobacteria bacterium]
MRPPQGFRSGPAFFDVSAQKLPQDGENQGGGKKEKKKKKKKKKKKEEKEEKGKRGREKEGEKRREREKEKERKNHRSNLRKAVTSVAWFSPPTAIYNRSRRPQNSFGIDAMATNRLRRSGSAPPYRR